MKTVSFKSCLSISLLCVLGSVMGCAAGAAEDVDAVGSSSQALLASTFQSGVRYRLLTPSGLAYEAYNAYGNPQNPELRLSQKNYSDTQKWVFVERTRGRYALQLVSGSNLCLFDGSPGVGVSSCANDPDGRWTVVAMPTNGMYQIRPAQDGAHCLLTKSPAPYQGGCDTQADWYFEIAQ